MNQIFNVNETAYICFRKDLGMFPSLARRPFKLLRFGWVQTTSVEKKYDLQ